MEKDIYSFAKEYGRGAGDVPDVSAGVSPLGPSKKVKSAIRKAVRDIGSYPAPASSRLGRFFKSRFGLSEDTLLFANSVKELLHVISSSFGPGRVLIAGPAPQMYEDTAAASGSEISRVGFPDAPGFTPDIESIRRNLAGVGLLFIANPNRITGRLMKKGDLAGIVDAASEMKTVVVADESLIEFTADEGLMSRAAGREDLIVLRTTANYHGLPGLELAYAVSSPAMIAKLSGKSMCAVSGLACEAARTAYKDKAYRRLVKEFIEEEKEIFAGAVKRMDRVTFYESDCNVFLLKVDCPEKNIRAALAGEGFLIEDCSRVEGLGAEYLRMSVMKHDQNRKILRILKERCL